MTVRPASVFPGVSGPIAITVLTVAMATHLGITLEHSMCAGQERLSWRFRRSVAVDVSIERAPGDVELFGQLHRGGLAVLPEGHGEAQERDVHFRRAPPCPAPCARRRHSGPGAFGDQVAFELGECREDVEHEPAVRGAGVDLGAGAGEHAETDATPVQVVDERDEVFQVAAEAVELRDASVLRGWSALRQASKLDRLSNRPDAVSM